MLMFMLACLKCEPVLPMPFTTDRERGEWAAQHTKGTGHHAWRVWMDNVEADKCFFHGVQNKIEIIDCWLDDKVADAYKVQPLAQHWARICKEGEEKGEAIAELILATGQNPRKPLDPDAHERLLKELADRAWTCVLAIQHFTKDVAETERVLAEKLGTITARVPKEYRCE